MGSGLAYESVPESGLVHRGPGQGLGPGLGLKLGQRLGQGLGLGSGLQQGLGRLARGLLGLRRRGQELKRMLELGLTQGWGQRLTRGWGQRLGTKLR